MATRNIPVKDMTVGQYFRSLMLSHLVVMISQLALSLIFFAHARTNKGSVVALAGTWFYVSLGVAFAVLAAGHFVFRSRLVRIRSMQTLADQLTAYRTAFVVRNIYPNMVSTFNLVLLYLSGNIRYLAITAMFLLVFAVWWPLRVKVMDDLGLESGLDDPDALIGDA